MSTSKFKLSIVIPAYNEEELLPYCLDSLVRQNTDHKFEVIVVDNNSTDSTTKVAQRYKDKLNIRVLLEKKKGRGVARHTGFKSSKSSIILSSDADAVLPPNWVEDILQPFSEKSVVAVTGPCRIDDLSLVKNTVFNFLQPLSMRVYRIMFNHYWLSGFNFAVRKKIYLEAGGFNQRLNALEDIDLGFKIKNLGKIVFLKNLTVVFSGRRFNDGLLKGFLQYLTTFAKYFLLKNKKNRAR